MPKNYGGEKRKKVKCKDSGRLWLLGAHAPKRTETHKNVRDCFPNKQKITYIEKLRQLSSPSRSSICLLASANKSILYIQICCAFYSYSANMPRTMDLNPNAKSTTKHTKKKKWCIQKYGCLERDYSQGQFLRQRNASQLLAHVIMRNSSNLQFILKAFNEKETLINLHNKWKNCRLLPPRNHSLALAFITCAQARTNTL